MVEYDSHLKQLLPASILDMYKKVFAHIDMLSMGLEQLIVIEVYKVFELIEMLSIDIHYQSYTDKLTLDGWDFGVLLGHFWSQNDVITSWLRLTATSRCYPHPI